MNIYLKDFTFLTERQESAIRENETRTFFNTYYPLGIFPQKGLHRVEFEPVTIFYGGNGSGKSTLLNIIATRLKLPRAVPFSPGQFFLKYIPKTKFNEQWWPNCSNQFPAESRILTSEDIFDKTLNLRRRNNNINTQHERISERWRELNYYGAEIGRMRSIHGPEYDAWKKDQAMIGKRKTMSQAVKDIVGFNVKTGSNGENAFEFFLEQIREETFYLLDEPENSLSAQWQVKLAQYLEDMARFERCQFVIATHSPFLLGIRGAKIYDLDSPSVPVRPWTELENVREYYEFFKARESEF